jgi:hypothetical protein
MPLTASSLTAALSGLPSGLGAFLASTLAGMLESTVNATITSTARDDASAIGMRLTPSAVICARRVTVVPPAGTPPAGGGVNLQLVLSDLFGPALVSAPRTLAVAVSPAPKATTSQTYTVTVTDAASGSPVPTATVTLKNYTASGSPATDAKTTDAAGRAVFTVSLRSKVTSVVVISSTNGGTERERESVTIPPTLRVDAAGFNSIRIVLL